ncbi:hypothetical protein [Undibacterium sp.]|uniref:hypothetical protein n=1 Tax=Undibacterium sp. TaxID=1914977 RepID=UPI00374FFFBE
MFVDTYKSAKDHTKFFTVPAGTDIKPLKFDDPDLHEVQAHNINLDIAPSDKRIGFDSAAAIAAIRKDGVYIHQAEIKLS